MIARRTLFTLALAAGALAPLSMLAARESMPAANMAASGEEGLVQAAMLVYGSERKTSVCFSSHFLKSLARETEINVDPAFATVDADSDDLFNHPFAIMTGEGSFDLTDAEIENLRRYLTSGGFLLASAGCSNDAWNASMRRAIELVLPDATLTEIALEHEIFHTVRDIKRFDLKKRTDVHIYGIELDGRIRLVYSPEGLNDTQNAGGGCCCCGGNEIRNAREVNMNILAYALTR